MAKSYVTYPGDGSTTTYSVTFPYLAKLHVHVLIGGEETDAWEWLTDSSIKLDAPSSELITIIRVTPTEPLVDFTDGSVLTENQLDIATIQSLYVAEETQDAAKYSLGNRPGDPDGPDGPSAPGDGVNWNAENKKLINLANGTKATDAINKGQLDEAAPALDAIAKRAEDAADDAEASATEATAAASAANASKVAAAGSATNAKNSEDSAKESEDKAKLSESAANASKVAAKVSEDNAKDSADKAKVSELAAKDAENKAEGHSNDAQLAAETVTDTVAEVGDLVDEAEGFAIASSNSADASAASAVDSKDSADKAKVSELEAQAIVDAFNPALVYKGSIDITGDSPADNTAGDAYTNTTTGMANGTWRSLAGQTVEADALIIYNDSNDWTATGLSGGGIDGYDKDEVDTLLDAKANVGDSYLKAETYNTTEIDGKLFDKADKTDTYTKDEVDSIAGSGGGGPSLDTSIGMVAPFAMDSVPTGWLHCDGSEVSRTTYSLLFSKVGDTYGVGDGSTTFNLPDLQDEFIRGSSDTLPVGNKQKGSIESAYSNGATANLKIGAKVADITKNEGLGWDRALVEDYPEIYASGASGTIGVQPSTQSNLDEKYGVTRPRNVAMLYCINATAEATTRAEVPSGGGDSIKAWVNFDGTTSDIRAENNIASVEEEITGVYKVTFKTPMPNANYCVIASSSPDEVNAQLQPQLFSNNAATWATTAPTVDSFYVSTSKQSTTRARTKYVHIAVIGEGSGSGGGDYTPEPLVWEDVTAERVAGTEYTNTQDVPIYIQTYVLPSAASQMVLELDGVSVGGSGANTNVINAQLSTIVPVGSTYAVKVTAGTGSIITWQEARMPVAVATGGSAKTATWASFVGNATPTTLNESNIASIDRISTGLYHLTFKEPMSSDDYSVQCSVGLNNGLASNVNIIGCAIDKTKCYVAMRTVGTTSPAPLESDSVKVSVSVTDSKTIAVATGGTPATWVNFDGATGDINKSSNIKSVERTAVGRFTVTFETPMDDEFYVATPSILTTSASPSVMAANGASATATEYRLTVGSYVNPSQNYKDVDCVMITFTQ